VALGSTVIGAFPKVRIIFDEDGFVLLNQS